MFETPADQEHGAQYQAGTLNVAGLLGADPGSLSAVELAAHLPELYRLKACVEAAIVDSVGVFDGRKQYSDDGAFSTSGWIAARADVTRAGASAAVKVARQARHVPAAMAAAHAGNLGFDKLRVLTAARSVSEATAAAFDDDEQRLVDEVVARDVETGARLMRSWVAAVDPDADDAAYDDREKQRKVNLSTSLDGMGFLDGLLTTEANAVLRSQLEAISDDLHRNGLSRDADGNRLTAAQLRHDALIEMARRAGASSTSVDVRRDAQQRAEQAAAERTAAQRLAEELVSADADDHVPGGAAADDGSDGSARIASDSPGADDPACGAETPTDDAGAPAVAVHPGDGVDDAHPADDTTVADRPEDADAADHRSFSDAAPVEEPTGEPSQVGDENPTDDEFCGGCGHDTTVTAAEGLLVPPDDSCSDAGEDDAAHGGGTGPPTDKIAGGLGHPLFTVLVDLDTFEDRAPPDPLLRVAEIVGAGPVPTKTIQRLLCDAGVSRLVTRGRSLPLDVGAVSRTATPAQWRALIAHAQGCEFPGCTAPWEWSQAHHLTPGRPSTAPPSPSSPSSAVATTTCSTSPAGRCGAETTSLSSSPAPTAPSCSPPPSPPAPAAPPELPADLGAVSPCCPA